MTQTSEYDIWCTVNYLNFKILNFKFYVLMNYVYGTIKNIIRLCLQRVLVFSNLKKPSLMSKQNPSFNPKCQDNMGKMIFCVINSLQYIHLFFKVNTFPFIKTILGAEWDLSMLPIENINCFPVSLKIHQPQCFVIAWELYSLKDSNTILEKGELPRWDVNCESDRG